MSNIPFQNINWEAIEKEEFQGEKGHAISQTLQISGLRIRIVDYSAGYLADHWCKKGHIVHCLEGEFTTELSTGKQIKLSKNQSFVVSDDLSEHRSVCEKGAKLLIVDGDFLR